MMAGSFTIIVAVLFIVAGALSFQYYAVLGDRVKFDTQSASRAPIFNFSNISLLKLANGVEWSAEDARRHDPMW